MYRNVGKDVIVYDDDDSRAYDDQNDDRYGRDVGSGHVDERSQDDAARGVVVSYMVLVQPRS